MAVQDPKDMAIGTWSREDFIAARRSLELTQTALAEAIGYTLRGVQKIEASGKIERVVELAVRFLLANPDQVVGLVTPRSPKPSNRLI